MTFSYRYPVLFIMEVQCRVRWKETEGLGVLSQMGFRHTTGNRLAGIEIIGQNPDGDALASGYNDKGVPKTNG